MSTLLRKLQTLAPKIRPSPGKAVQHCHGTALLRGQRAGCPPRALEHSLQPQPTLRLRHWPLKQVGEEDLFHISLLFCRTPHFVREVLFTHLQGPHPWGGSDNAV